MAVTHDGHFVGDAEDLVHLVGDVDNGNAVGLQVLDDAEEGFHFVGRQRGGRLVQNQYLTVGGNGLGDLHRLHLRNAQLAQHLPGIEVHPDLFQQSGGIGVHFFMVDHGNEAQKLLHGITAQEDVLADGSGGNGLQLLMDHGNTHFQSLQGILDGHLFALVIDLAFVHAVDAEHALHQCGLTGTVFSHERVNLAGMQAELGVVQRFYTGEGLTNTAHFQAVFTH